MQLRHFFVLITTILAVTFLLSTEPVIAKSTSDSSTKTTVKKSKSTKSTTSKSTKAKSGKVNINTANAEVLTQLTGIGPKTAKNIVNYRKKHGKFKRSDDLLKVKGIGEKTLKKMKSQIKL